MKALALACLALSYTSVSVAQNCVFNSITEVPNSRYIMNDNGTLLDKKTGLMWMRCALGRKWSNNSCDGAPTYMNFQSALQSAKSTNFAGFNDWRLPNKKELLSIISSHCYAPSSNSTAFPGIANDYYWSSSVFAYNGYRAWVSSLYNAQGYFDEQDYYNAVLLVRGEEINSP